MQAKSVCNTIQFLQRNYCYRYLLSKLELKESERLVDGEEEKSTNPEQLNALYHADLLTILLCNIKALNGRFQLISQRLLARFLYFLN